MKARWIASCCWLLLFGAVGCNSEGISRYRVQGTVTFNGQPVPAGQIVFEPDNSAGNTGAAGSALIEDGKFDTGDKGVIGGPHIVRIDGGTKGGPNDEAGQTLFRAYEVKMDFPKQATTQNIEVPGSAATSGPSPVNAGP